MIIDAVKEGFWKEDGRSHQDLCFGPVCTLSPWKSLQCLGFSVIWQGAILLTWWERKRGNKRMNVYCCYNTSDNRNSLVLRTSHDPKWNYKWQRSGTCWSLISNILQDIGVILVWVTSHHPGVIYLFIYLRRPPITAYPRGSVPILLKPSVCSKLHSAHSF